VYARFFVRIFVASVTYFVHHDSGEIARRCDVVGLAGAPLGGR